MKLPFKFPERYEFNGERYEGGQGHVYICLDALLDRKVAIKIMKDVPDGTLLKKEMSALKDIRSKHIAEIFDLVVDEKTTSLGLVQEFVPGESLDDWSSKNGDVSNCLSVLQQFACGISDIHAHGKIHRDIKPSNAKFDAELVLKILDFGLVQPSQPDPKTMFSRGTVYFRAPEMYQAPPVKLTNAVDVYAFGVSAAIVCNGGKLPTELKTLPPKANNFSFSQCRVVLQSEVVKMLDSTLALAPKDRPQIAEVRDVLERRMLHGQHRAVICLKGRPPELLSKPGTELKLQKGADGISITYDGLVFRTKNIVGNIYINNKAAVPEAVLPGSCVITIGEPALGAQRGFVSVDMSHPGVES
jgi:serine/threonine protein kinase